MPIDYGSQVQNTTASAYTTDVNATPNTVPLRDAQGGINASTFHGTATTAQTINNLQPSTSNDPNTVVIRDANGNAKIGSYLGRVNAKGDLNSLSANYQDFAWVDDEQTFYWYAGNGWFPYDVKRLKEGFTLVNLLGSYGGFEKDSNGDGLADGWLGGAANNSLVSGINGTAQQGTETYSSSTQSFRFLIILEPLHKYFSSWYVNANRSDGSCGVVGFRTSNQIYLFINPTEINTWQNKYGSFTTSANDQYESGYGFYLYIANRGGNAVVGETYTAVFDNLCLYDLTWMDQYSPMPQSLQEKYSVSKWADMTDDDLTNELPYVDGVAYVGVGL